MVETVGFIAFTMNVIGNLMLTKKIIHGWTVCMVSIGLWGMYSLGISSMPMILNSAVFMGINYHGLRSWRKLDSANE
jgi:hypothetical protein